MTQQRLFSPDESQSGFRSFPGPVPREYYYHYPSGLHAGSPILVSVHGISRNAAEHMVRMRGIAEAAGAVIVAPFFGKKFYPRYQQLEDRARGIRSDLALIDILAAVRRETGVETPTFHLTGFSGGAQFAHRFAIFHADRVSTCVSCSAGWYSFPEPDIPFPLGLADGSGPGGISPHPDWHSVQHHVVVGSRDNAIEDALNMTAPVVELQGVGRRTRARRWVRSINRVRDTRGLQPVAITELRGLSHDYTRAHDRHDLAWLIADRMGLNRTREYIDA